MFLILVTWARSWGVKTFLRGAPHFPLQVWPQTLSLGGHAPRDVDQGNVQAFDVSAKGPMNSLTLLFKCAAEILKKKLIRNAKILQEYVHGFCRET